VVHTTSSEWPAVARQAIRPIAVTTDTLPEIISAAV
jgi:hypothetical protein